MIAHQIRILTSLSATCLVVQVFFLSRVRMPVLCPDPIFLGLEVMIKYFLLLIISVWVLISLISRFFHFPIFGLETLADILVTFLYRRFLGT